MILSSGLSAGSIVSKGKSMELLIIIIFCISIICKICEAKAKGYMGEKAVAAELSGLLEMQYKILNDVMLRTEYGTTQIDHIVVSVYGIFVIETKNYQGWITGSEFGDYWTKNMYGEKYTFRNPLKQNYAHVKALEEKLQLSENKFIPIVAFSSNSDIKVKTSKPVVHIGQLKWVIEGYREIKFDYGELDVLIEKIKSENIVEKSARKKHVRQIQQKVAVNNAKVLAGICPRCGGQLVSRKGKNGVFVGCSNFPKCRYTKNG